LDHDEPVHPLRPGKHPEVNSDRRDFLEAAALSGVVVLVTGIPLASYVIAPAMKKGIGRWIDFGTAENLTPGAVSMLTYDFMAKDGWLVLPQRGFIWVKTGSDRQLTVFSSTCTHLACSVVWREAEHIFECPCHSGIFDADGRPISGPPKRPLDVLKHKVENGKLMVYLTV
jgi:Rieske Fe-S protein